LRVVPLELGHAEGGVKSGSDVADFQGLDIGACAKPRHEAASARTTVFMTNTSIKG
jgi:hypothetical protein